MKRFEFVQQANQGGCGVVSSQLINGQMETKRVKQTRTKEAK
jgi:hypothetical protein